MSTVSLRAIFLAQCRLVIGVMRWPRWLFVVLALPILGQAFPPAPYYAIYGTVRDQVGATLLVEGAELVLLRNGLEIGRTPVFSQLKGDFNYELKIRIDQNRLSTRTYSSRPCPPTGFTLSWSK